MIYKYFLLINILLFNFIVPNNLEDEQCYAIVKQSLLNKYKRPFAMLGIGLDCVGNLFKIAHDYNSTCVMVADDQLLKKFIESKLENIIFLNKLFTSVELEHLSECEHFDVIMLFDNIQELFKYNWQQSLDAILNMGDYVVLKVSSDNQAIKNYISIKCEYSLNRLSNFDIYIIKSGSKYLKRTSWLRVALKDNLYQIDSSFEHKNLIKPIFYPKTKISTGHTQTVAWVPGINLCTFKMCHGLYPTNQILKDSLRKISGVPHTDWMINNMIVSGTNLYLIDCDDPTRKAFFSQELLKAHEEIIDLYDPKEIESYFWYKLTKRPDLMYK